MSNFPDLDEVEESRATFLSHLLELRSRLLKSAISLIIAFIFCFSFADVIYNFLVQPYDAVMRQLANKPAVLIFTAPQEFFITQLKIAFYGALLISFPLLLTQVYLFIAPALYKGERSALIPYLIATPLFFILGTTLVYLLLPMILKIFANMQQTDPNEIQIELLPKVSEYLDLIMSLAFAFGIVFQLPVLLTLLAKLGFFSANELRKRRRWAILLAFIFAAILTPPDPLSQIALAVPTIILYEVSIIAVAFSEKRAKSAKNATCDVHC